MAKSNKKAAAAVLLVSSAPTKVNAQQERFLRLVAEGNMTQQRAYEVTYGVGGKSAEANAARLLSYDKFKKRLAEIQADNAAAAQVSVGSVTRMYRRIYDEAMAAGERGPAVLATTGLAKLHGLVVDRLQAEVLMRKPSEDPDAPAEMSADQWMEIYAKAPVLEGDFKRVAAPSSPAPPAHPVAEPQAPSAEPRAAAGAEPRGGPNVWKPEDEPDPYAASSNEVRRRTASGSAKHGAVIDMNDESDAGGVDRVVSAPRRPVPAADVAEIETLDGGARDGSDMFAAAKPEPRPRDLIAEQFEISSRE